MNRSTLIMSIISIILLIIGFVGGYVYGSMSTGAQTTATATSVAQNIIEIPVGILAPLSGAGAVEGTSISNGIIMGIEDVNAFLAASGASFRIKYFVEDTKTNPDEALKALQKLYQNNNVRIVFGGQFSRELMALKPFAEQNKVVVISSYSTTPALAIPKKYVFRNIGPDTLQGKALASLLCREGIENVAIIHRNDAYGAGLAQMTQKYFLEKCGKKAEIISYNPDQPDYASEVRVLADKVTSLGPGPKTAVVMIAFETDGSNILKHAQEIPVLSQVRWFGSESTRVPEVLLQPGNAEFVYSVRWTGTFPTAITSIKYQEFINKYRAKYGKDPFPVAANGYDAAWLVGLALMATGGKVDDIDKFVNALIKVAESYYGVTGLNAFDENGDRRYQDYSIWTVEKQGDKYVIVDKELYHSDTDTFTKL